MSRVLLLSIHDSVYSSLSIGTAAVQSTFPLNFPGACSSFILSHPMGHPRLALVLVFEFHRLMLHSRP
jgi:hypothetical protein